MNIIQKIKLVIVKFIFILTKKQKQSCLILFFLLVIGSFLEMVGVSAIIPLVNVILSPDKLMKNSIIKKLTQWFSISNLSTLVIMIAMITIAVYVFKNVYMMLLSYLKNKSLRRIEREVSCKLMDSYLKRPYTFHLDTNSSLLIRSIGSDATITITILMNLFNILLEVMSVTLIGVFLIIMDYSLALTVMGLASFSFFLVTVLFKKVLSKQGKIALLYRGECLRHINQAFNGIKDVLVTRRQKYFMDNYQKAIIKSTKAATIQGFSGECATYIIEGVCISGFIIALCIKSLIGGDSALFVAQAAAFAVSAFRILPSIGKITNNLNQIVYYYPCLEDVYKNIYEVEEYERSCQKKNRKDTDVQKEQFHKKQIQKEPLNTSIHLSVNIRDVTWKYPNSETVVLDKLSMIIQKGTSIGLIGPSGTGKTTLADMILGLLPPLEGRIEMDGTNIAEIPSEWSKVIGYVPQVVFLTDDTLRNNVAFGIEESQISDILIWEALEQAQLANFVKSLPDGLDTIVGEQGIRFSGGQRQRVAIARALYYNPDILVLDEATSALDNDTEIAVMEAIESLQGHKTLIIVAHRLSTIRECDVIYEIVNGKAILKEKADIFEKD